MARRTKAPTVVLFGSDEFVAETFEVRNVARGDHGTDQAFRAPDGLDGRRRHRLCNHQQLVGLCRVPLYELGLHQ